jgi:hypothetical protein
MDHYLDRARGTQLYTGKKMRSRFLLGSLALTTCLTRQAIVVAPKPSVRADSVARGAFARSALDLLEQVANADSLDLVAVGATGRECFTRRDFHVCGHMQDSVVIIEFVQGGTSSFSDGNERVRQDVLQQFQDAFGQDRVRECTSHGSICPNLAQIDSANRR